MKPQVGAKRHPKAPRAPVASGSVQIADCYKGETYVYRAYCKCGDLLYVGIAGNLFNRIQGHYSNRSEWEKVYVRLEWDLHPSRRIAEQEEQRQIRELHPLHNIAWAVPNPRRAPESLPWPTFDPRLGAREAAVRIRHRLLGNRL